MREGQNHFSSQVHSTGLCHLSAFYPLCYLLLARLGVLLLFTLNTSMFAVVPLLFPK